MDPAAAAAAAAEKKELDAIAALLLKGVDKREVTESGRRVPMFKGSRMVKFIMECKDEKTGLAKCEKEADALKVMERLLSAGYIHCTEAAIGRKKTWQMKPLSRRDLHSDIATLRFVWDYTGSNAKLIFWLTLLVLGGIGILLFPLWPYAMKRGAQLLSMTLLVIMVGTMILRLVIYGLAWIVGYELWVLPNLFDDNKTLYWPLYSVEKSGPGQGLYRVGALAALALLGYYIYTQPTEFEQFVGAQRSFIADLYSGSLIGDINQAGKDYNRAAGVDLDADVHDDILSDILGPIKGVEEEKVPDPLDDIPLEDLSDEDAILAELRREQARSGDL